MNFSLRVASVLLLLLLSAALTFGIYTGLTRNALGANDFYSRWMGARALFLRGQNPYSETVTREIQMGMYGRLVRADEDQVAFAYPLYAAYAAAPLIFFAYDVAQALWLALLVLGVVVGALALARVNDIRLSPLALAAILFGALFFYPSVRGIFLGQYALFSFACIALASLAIASGHQTTAGILLAVATVKPQPLFFLFPIVLFWAWWNGKRGVVWSALGMLGVLLVSSFLFVPTWVFDFLDGLRNYAQYAPVGPPLETFFKLLLPTLLAPIFFLVSSALMMGGMLWLVWRNRTCRWNDFQFTLGVVAVVTTLIAGRIGTPDQALLLIFWMAQFAAWGVQKQFFPIAVCVLILLVAPWFAFLNLLQGSQEAIVVTTILPMFTLLIALVMPFAALRKQRFAK